VISMGVWVIGIYYFQDTRLHRCRTVDSEILIVDEASADITMNNESSSYKHFLCETFEPGKLFENVDEDKELPIATMIESNQSNFVSCSQDESGVMPTLVRSAFVNITPRRSLTA
jgi:hypothetical protein